MGGSPVYLHLKAGLEERPYGPGVQPRHDDNIEGVKPTECVMDQTDRTMESAKKNLKAIRDFMYHLMVYLFVCGLLVILDVRAGVGDQAVVGLDWAYWVILFWGIGLVGHGIYAFFGDHRIEARYEKERTRDLVSH